MSYIPPETFNIPAGAIAPFSGTTVPTGWLLCQGQTVSREEYENLFIVIREYYGAGDGITTFGLPDFRGRIMLAAGSVTGLTKREVAEIGGAESHTLTIDEMASHTHNAYNQLRDQAGGTGVFKLLHDVSGVTEYTPPSLSEVPHNNMQPYTVILGYIIKY